MKFNLNNLIRDNIKILQPYSSARDEFSGDAKIYLDANENAWGSPLTDAYNRYPDTEHSALKLAMGAIKKINKENIFIGNGSDEIIDLLQRAFCEPKIDKIIILPPTYGMYKVCANINNVEVKEVLLNKDFSLNTTAILAAIDEQTKMIFICSPNNPSGNLVDENQIELLLNSFNGIIVLDEAYIDFARTPGFVNKLTQFPNLVIIQTLSKAWGLASLRIGIAFASASIIQLLTKIKPPYNISKANQQLALQALQKQDQIKSQVTQTIKERNLLMDAMQLIEYIETTYPSEANFILIKIKTPSKLYNYLQSQGIIIRDRSQQPLCEGCVRITVGTTAENNILIQALNNFQ